ncbi:3-dehydroquinate synthase family protein [Pseudothioglobus sp. nBUS_23]|uniref:3-dehydroquinate synthase n=1 Tax=Pseudothioglobus sp. nBUS_23 TaxID=3395318 RepID=UPI003EB92A9B
MFETFEVESSIKNYKVLIEKGSVHNFINDKSFFIIDSHVYDLWPSINIKECIKIDAKESNKSLKIVSEVIKNLKDSGANRSSSILAIGGGITQDLSTFCASTFMRGISWVYVPTTLLGMTDSCIGGKSSINVGRYKNIIGNYYPPEIVVVDTNFCKTLTIQQILEGLFEAVKISYAHSEFRFEKHISYVNHNQDLYCLDFEKIVFNSLISKKEIIEEDEFDEGIRLLLNFGHTFGHALEGASRFKISHGVAVGLGMIAAFNLSISLNLIQEENIKARKLINHLYYLLEMVEGLSYLVNNIDMKVAYDNFKSDKKHLKGVFFMILFDNEGKLIRHKLNKSVTNEILIINSFESLKTI